MNMSILFSKEQNIGRNQRGQTLILAVVIMFLLVFIGVIFIAMVTRNLFRAGRSSDMLKVEQLARAGIEYADSQLNKSEEGADWRPTPEYPDIVDPADIVTTYPIVADDPDRDWILKERKDRFSRINSGEGRFLLRVSYNPDPADPLSKYIKIESIGRMGVVNPADPTTMATGRKHLLRVELTAYKPIGVTDYVRFVTNKEKRTVPVALGAPGIATVFGNPDNGGSIRVNGNLIWHGRSVDIYLRGATSNPAVGVTPVTLPIDTVAVAGEIMHSTILHDKPTITPVTITNIGAGASNPDPIVPSKDDDFTTFEGYYRDGFDMPDEKGYARAIRRIEPPLLDIYDRATKNMRYRALTRDSGEWLERGAKGSGDWYNTGYYGWGKGIYIDNWNDVQRESETLFGGYTLRADWTKPNNEMSPYWRGPFYVPPGVQITINPGDTNGDEDHLPDITLTRTDIGPNNTKRVWLDENGKQQIGWGQTITMDYLPIKNASGDPIPGEYEHERVIYAEGNIRIKGMLPPGVKLTVVSGATIYIEGSVLKYREPNSTEPDQSCAIALLAKDYVCLNTTQFVSLLTETGPAAIGADSQTGDPPFHLIVAPEPTSNFRTSFSFGPAGYLADANFRPFICARHAGQYGSAYINMWVNRGPDTSMNEGLYNFADMLDFVYGDPQDAWPLPSGWPGWIYGVSDSNCGGFPGSGVGTVFEHRVWPLAVDVVGVTDPIGKLTPAVGRPNYIELGLDQTTISRNNYLLSGFAVQPMDIVVEAIIYAQNKSFFIIPGPWFNPNPEDTKAQYDKTKQRPFGTDPSWAPISGSMDRPANPTSLYPFFGQSLDIKITINGAVTENLPASIADVGEWSAKWCNIPEKYGSSSVDTAHPRDGITYLYDQLLSCPLADPLNKNSSLRKDKYDRPLPIAPKLPVSPTLIYSGEAL
ncbi:MAG: hypothetical protein Q7N50_16175 [Armatimonadota bacterium]|nr:hypothetical protein [Armatimonadota bacterium]